MKKKVTAMMQTRPRDLWVAKRRPCHYAIASVERIVADFD